MNHRGRTWAIFTDLDGTLLDHKSYRWSAARQALDCMRQNGVPLILVTSKTRAEVIPILRSLRRREPFVVENGGAIYIPTGYFPFAIPTAQTADRGWHRVVLGTPRGRLITALQSAAVKLNVPIRNFASMRAREVSQRTDMGLTEARRAKRREFDEPFLVLDGGGAGAMRLCAEIRRRGFQHIRGSRFLHIMGRSDKGKAVRKLTAWLRRKLGSKLRIAALGESPNDISMLRAVNVPIVVALPGRRYDAETLAAVPKARRAGGIGPKGWNRAVLALLGCRCV